MDYHRYAKTYTIYGKHKFNPSLHMQSPLKPLNGWHINLQFIYPHQKKSMRIYSINIRTADWHSFMQAARAMIFSKFLAFLYLCASESFMSFKPRNPFTITKLISYQLKAHPQDKFSFFFSFVSARNKISQNRTLYQLIPITSFPYRVYATILYIYILKRTKKKLNLCKKNSLSCGSEYMCTLKYYFISTIYPCPGTYKYIL